MSTKKPTYEELKKRLAKTEALLAMQQKKESKSKNMLDMARDQRDVARDKRHTSLLDTKEYLEAYKTSEQNFKNSIDASPLGVRIVTADGDLIYANQAILDICGYKTAQEMAAVPRSKLYTPQSYQAHVERNKKRKLKEYLPSEYEIDIQRPDGEVRNLQVFRREVIWGGEQQFMALYQDITERKRAEDIGKHQRELLNYQASLIDNVSDAIVSSDNDFRIISWNKAAEKMYGWREDEVIGKNVLKLLKPIYLNANMNDIQASMDKTGYWKGESIHTSKNGTKLNVLDSISMRRDEQGNNIGAVTIFKDITERKNIENALKESEERFSKAFYASPDAVSISRVSDGVFLEVNDSYIQDTGYTREEIIGKSAEALNMFQSKEQRDKVNQIVQSHKRMYNEEFQFHNKLGELRTKLISSEYITLGGEPCLLVVSTDITELKQAEEALRESEEKFHTIVEHSNDGVAFISNGIVLYCNPKLLEMGGYSETDVLGKPFINFVAPESKAKVLDIYNKRLAGQKTPDKYELNLLTKDGGIVNTEVSASIITVKQESVDIALVRDITERKKVEETLANEVTRRRILIEQSRDGIVILDQDGNVFESNQRFADMLGYTTEEMKQLHVFDWEFLYPKERVVEMIRTVDEKGDHFETQHRRKDGTTYDVEISTNGAVFGGQKLIFCVCRDMSERKQMEKALEESERKYRSLYENSNFGILLTYPTGEIIAANPAACRIFGRTEEEICQIGREGLIDSTDPRLKKALEIRRITGQFNGELTFIRADGTKFPGDISSKIFLDTDGKEKTSMIIQDITERKQMEQSVRESEEKFSKAFSSSPEMMIIVNIDEDRYIEVNDSFVKCLGYSREELIGHTAVEFNLWVYPEEKEKMDRLIQEQGKFIDEEFRFRTKNGEIRTWLCSADTLDIGGVRCMLGTSTDITERRKSQEALRESQEKFSKAFVASPAIIAVTTLKDGKYSEINDTFIQATGYTREEVIGKTALSMNSWANPQDRERMLRILKEHGRINREEFNFRIKSGEIRTWLFSAEPITFGGEACLIGVAIDITERKQTEQALKESQEMFSLAFRNSPILLLISTIKDGRIIEANDIYCQATGYSREELIGHSTLELKLWHDPEQRRAMIEELKKKGTVSNVDVKVRIKTGDIRLVNMSMAKITLKNEPCLITIAEDITERRKMEEQLERERQDIKLIMDTSRALIWYKDVDGKMLRVNRAFAEALNMSEKDFIGKTVFDIYSKDIARGMTNDDREVLVSGSSKLNIIEQYESKAGLRWVQTDKVPVLDSNGKPIAIIGFAQDITESKLAEQRINYLNQTLRSIRNVNQLITREKDRDKLLQGVCDTLVKSHSFYTSWIVLLDESNKIITYAMSGFGKEPYREFKPIVEEFKKGNPPPCAKKALKKSSVVTSEDPLTTCAGCPIISESPDFGSMTTRLEYDGNIYGVFCASLPKVILTDADEVSLFEEVANDIAFALYNIERQAEFERLEEERLRAAKLESIGTLAGGIAHDFNNLLTGIMGNIGLVKTNMSPTEPTFEMLEEAEKAALRARDLTQQLLTFARGGKPIKKPVHIAEIIKEAATFALRGSKVKLEISLPDNLWPIEADEGQISQVINNLVLNADEAMAGGGTLKIQAENETLKSTAIQLLPGGNYVRIDIADSGIGISAEHLQRIFEPYFTTKQRGSGLGLTSAYSIVRNHGGTILAQSTQNQGSTFRIYLPATKKTLMKGGKRMTAEKAGQAGGKILVMDDEEIIRKMLKNMLSLAGYTVEISADGTEALAKYQQARNTGDPFNAVIMDLTIPGGMGGREAVQKLLEIDPNAIAIVSSGYATDAIMSDYEAYGFKAVIAKPYSAKQLQETLSGLLTRKKK